MYPRRKGDSLGQDEPIQSGSASILMIPLSALEADLNLLWFMDRDSQALAFEQCEWRGHTIISRALNCQPSCCHVNARVTLLVPRKLALHVQQLSGMNSLPVS